MNKQEIFNKVASSLLKQQKPAMKPRHVVGYVCAYVTDEGERCAAGWLLNTEQTKYAQGVTAPYDRLLEFFRLNNISCAPWMKQECDFITALQRLHDSHATTLPTQQWFKQWRERMLNLGTANALDTSVLKDA